MSSYAAMSDCSSMSSDTDQQNFPDFLELDVNENTSAPTKQGYIPHHARPLHTVKKRNARERNRVETVNNAFARLRKHIPYENKNKRLSKVKTLRKAMDYIRHLQSLLSTEDTCNDVQRRAMYGQTLVDVMTSHLGSPEVNVIGAAVCGRLQEPLEHQQLNNSSDWSPRSNNAHNISPGSTASTSPYSPSANQYAQNYLNNMTSHTASYHVTKCAVPQTAWHHGNQQMTSLYWDGSAWTL